MKMDYTKSSSSGADDQEKIEFRKQEKMPFHMGTFELEDSRSQPNDFIDKQRTNWISENNRTVDLSYEHSVSALDVAAYILSHLGPMTTMKLQKIVYYCQAWSLVWDEKLLFKEDIEAWANGPVVRELFNYHRGRYMISSVLIGNPDLLDDQQKETVEAVLDYYGNKSSQWLSDLTHMEDPWKLTRIGMPEMQRGKRVIKPDVIADYYSSLPPND